jgi:hypothetical protein
MKSGVAAATRIAARPPARQSASPSGAPSAASQGLRREPVRVLEEEPGAVLEHVVADVDDEQHRVRRVARAAGREGAQLVVGRIAGDAGVQHLDTEAVLEAGRKRILQIDLHRLDERIAEDEDAPAAGSARELPRTVALAERVHGDGAASDLLAAPADAHLAAHAGDEGPAERRIGTPEGRLPAAAVVSREERQDGLAGGEREGEAEERERRPATPSKAGLTHGVSSAA